MHKHHKYLLPVTLLTVSANLSASGYYLPEQSTNATALTAAYIANAHGADASFYNPANLVFTEDKQGSMELDLLWVHSPEIDFTGTSSLIGDISNSAESQDVLVPNFFYISPDIGNNWRFGFSSYSTGLKTDWKSGYQLSAAEKADIQSTELTPVVSYKFSDRFSVGGGVRFSYTDAKVKLGTLDLSGDGWDYGYNLAMTFRPTQKLSIAGTYRSKITTKLEGDAFVGVVGPIGGNADYILPANLGLGIAYSFDNTTVELAYNRLFWSDYDSLDINLDGLGTTSQTKNWSDTHTYRLGITHQYSPALTLMAGITFDETPIPDSTMAFEILDNDFVVYGLGAKYKLDDKWTLGGAFLYADGDGRSYTSASYAPDTVQGSFDRDLYVYNLSLTYTF
jgi:long-chain fatty acid transport protein